jgi:predicted dehydrogenase
MVEKLRVGIISAAWGAVAHLPAWRSLDDIDVVAICTSRPETAHDAARRHGIKRAFWDYEEMARDPNIDIIDAGTRPRMRHPMVSAALRGKKHVYAGMPFGMSTLEALEMCRLQEEANLIGAVDAFIQATPAARHMRQMIGGGFLGTLAGVRCAFHLQLFTSEQVNVPTYAWFADKSQGASVLRNLGGHALHAIVAMFGDIQEVVGHGSRHLDQWIMPDGSVLQPQVDDNSVTLFKLEQGTVGQLSLSWSATDGAGFSLEAWGSKGRMVLESPTFPQANNTLLFAGEAGGLSDHSLRQIPLPATLFELEGCSLRGHDNTMGVFPMATIFREMTSAIRTGGVAEPSFRQALHVQQVVDAIEQSYIDGKWIAV